jgi:hypothetical protein
MVIHGHTFGHHGTIQSATLSGPAACANLTPNTPWHILASSPGHAKILAVSLGACGPQPVVHVTIGAPGTPWKITSAPVGLCTLSVILTMTPPISD